MILGKLSAIYPRSHFLPQRQKTALAGDLTVENIIVGSTNIITEINTKQNIINDDDLAIPKILNLQSSLNT
jgi:hypothetical protein